MQYQNGQRVVYTGKRRGYKTSTYIGREGTVISQSGLDSVTVKWDLRLGPPRTVYAENIELINEEKEMNTQFKKGDRVEFHQAHYGDASYNGKRGTVVSSLRSTTEVLWDDVAPIRPPMYPYPANLRLIPAEFKVGDRVLIAKKLSNSVVGCPAWNSGAGMDKTLGKLGTIVEIGTYIRVRVDGCETWFYGKASLEHATIPNDKAVAEALAVLQMAGSVTFKPTRLPFEPSTIKLNSQYTAEVTEKGVTVGCQTFSLEIIDQLAAAVGRAHAYNNTKAS